jgi:hypothetical protein
MLPDPDRSVILLKYGSICRNGFMMLTWCWGPAAVVGKDGGGGGGGGVRRIWDDDDAIFERVSRLARQAGRRAGGYARGLRPHGSRRRGRLSLYLSRGFLVSGLEGRKVICLGKGEVARCFLNGRQEALAKRIPSMSAAEYLVHRKRTITTCPPLGECNGFREPEFDIHSRLKNRAPRRAWSFGGRWRPLGRGSHLVFALLCHVPHRHLHSR